MTQPSSFPRSFAALGGWAEHVPPRTQRPNEPDPSLVPELEKVMALDRVPILLARRALRQPSLPIRPVATL